MDVPILRVGGGSNPTSLARLRAGDPHGDVATMWQAREAVLERYAPGDRDLALECG